MRVLTACPVILAPSDVDGWHVWDHRPHLVIDNSPAEITASWADLAVANDWLYLAGGHNRGVARSWNLAMQTARDLGYDAVALLSQTYRPSGGTSFLAWCVGEYGDWRGLLNGSVGLHGCVWSVALWERVGPFDERYEGGYYEDNDWLYRLALHGLHDAANPMPKVEIPGTSDPALALRRGAVPEHVYGENAARYAAKWGGPPGAETVTDPDGLPCSG